jgi:hypothetical protein
MAARCIGLCLPGLLSLVVFTRGQPRKRACETKNRAIRVALQVLSSVLQQHDGGHSMAIRLPAEQEQRRQRGTVSSRPKRMPEA